MIIILTGESQLIHRLMYFGNTALIPAVGRDKNRKHRQPPVGLTRAVFSHPSRCLPTWFLLSPFSGANEL